jgi:hypothetical protein
MDQEPAIPENLHREMARACAALFPDASALTRGKPLRLDKKTLHRSYRARALGTHPDRAVALGRSEIELTARFAEVQQAYDLLQSLLHLRDSIVIPPLRPAQGHAARCERRPKVPTGSPARRNAARGRRAASRKRDSSWKGRIPERRLLLGQYLYFAGAISIRELVSAIVWQRRQRPFVGQIAVSWGILSPRTVRHTLSTRRPGERFCEAAVRIGRMTPFQQMAVLGRQRQLQEPFGRYFIENAILRPDEIEALAAQAWRHNSRQAAGRSRSLTLD